LIDTILSEVEKLNSLTGGEYAELVATWFAQGHKEFQCGECLGAYAGREGRDQVIEASRKRKFCWGADPKDAKAGFTIEGIKYKTCPGNLWSNDAAFWIKAWWDAQRGMALMPEPMFEWPAKVMQIFSVLDKLESQKQTEAQRKGKKEQDGQRSQNRRPVRNRRG
jgi:hypothetical protein